MSKFVVAPHFRLHEWVAEEKGYFRAEGLDYEFRETMDSSTGSGHHIGNKVGAYQTLEAGRTCNVSAACHWTMNVAASNGHGKLYSDCYSVSPCGVFVPPESPVKTPADLAGVAISESAISRAATTRRSKASNSTSSLIRSTCRSTTDCCSAAWSA